MKIHSIQKAASDFDIPYHDAILSRLRFVRQSMFDELQDIKPINRINSDSDEIIFWTTWNNCIDLAHEQLRLVRELGCKTNTSNRITDTQIEQSRLVPIEQLIGFDRQGKALAWCHADKVPSLTWHRSKNRATCFPCGKTFNSIDVLVQRDGMTFIDAVKALSGGTS